MNELQIVAGSLANPTCFTTPQAFANDFADVSHVLLGDITGIIVSDTTPDPNDRDKAWIKLASAGGPPVYGLAPAVFAGGHWIIRHPTEPGGSERRLWTGTTTALETYDGGSAGVVNDASGPMWQVDEDFAARMPIGPGTLPISSTVVAVGDTGGEEKHVLTEAEGAVGSHKHAFGVSNPGNDDASFRTEGAATTVTSYTGYYITGSNGNIVNTQTTADLFTSPANLGAGVTSAAHQNMPPYRGVYFIKRTARKFILVA